MAPPVLPCCNALPANIEETPYSYQQLRSLLNELSGFQTDPAFHFYIEGNPNDVITFINRNLCMHEYLTLFATLTQHLIQIQQRQLILLQD